MAAILRAFAARAQRPEIMALVDLTRSDFVYGSDERALSCARQVYEAASANLDRLDDYGIDAARLSALQSAIEVFQAAIPAPRVAIASGSVAPTPQPMPG